MPQIFHHSTNALAKLSIFGAVFILLAALWVAVETKSFVLEHRPVG